MKNIAKSVIMTLFLAAAFSAAAQSEDATSAIASTKYSYPEEISITAVHPNPATKRVIVEFTTAGRGEEMRLRIRNSDGKIVLRRNLYTLPGSNMVILPVSAWPSGEYTIILDEGKSVRRARWQKM